MYKNKMMKILYFNGAHHFFSSLYVHLIHKTI